MTCSLLVFVQRCRVRCALQPCRCMRTPLGNGRSIEIAYNSTTVSPIKLGTCLFCGTPAACFGTSVYSGQVLSTPDFASLAHPATESRPAAVCSAVVSYLFIFNNFCQTIFPIFAKISLLVELWLQWMIILKLVFRSLQGRCHGNQFLLQYIQVSQDAGG